MVKRGMVPDRWVDYTPIGKRIEGTRFIAFKVPLSKHVCDHVNNDRIELHPDKLLDYIPNLGLIVDLTNTTKYYDSEFFPKNGVEYVKVQCPGKVVPPERIRYKFNQHVKRYLAENRDNDKLIGVHCTHGVNRAGYFICSFMVTELKMDPLTAIANFEMARGHSIERVNYRNTIMTLKLTASKLRKESWRSKSSDSNDDHRRGRIRRQLSKEKSSRSPVKSIEWKRISKNSEERNSSVRLLSRDSYTRRSSDRNLSWKRSRKDSDGKDSSIPSEAKWAHYNHNRNPKESSERNDNYNNRHNDESSYENRTKRPKFVHREYQNNANFNRGGENSRRINWQSNRFGFNKTKNTSFNARDPSRYVYVRKEPKGDEYQGRQGQERNLVDSSRDYGRRDDYQGRQERNQEDSGRDHGRRDEYQGRQERSSGNSSRNWEKRDERQHGRWDKNVEESGRDRERRNDYQGRYEKNSGDLSRNYEKKNDYHGRQKDYEKRDGYQERKEVRDRRNDYQGRQENHSRDRGGRDEYQVTNNYGTYKTNRSNPFNTKPRIDDNDRNYPERYERDSRRDEWEKKDYIKAPHPRELPQPRWKADRNERDSSRQSYHQVKSRPDDERRNFREIAKTFSDVVRSQPRWLSTHSDDNRRN